MKPDCYKCRWRGRLQGDAHSKCCHPYNRDIINDPFTNLMGVFASVGRIEMPEMPYLADNRLKIKANPTGIRGGWFHYPVNFDPTWLENCAGFEELRENDARKLSSLRVSDTCEQPYTCDDCPKRFECFTDRTLLKEK